MGWNGSDIVKTPSGASKRAENAQVREKGAQPRENNAPMREKSPRSTRRLATLLSVFLPILICILAGYFYFFNTEDNLPKPTEKQEKPKVIKRETKRSAKVELPKTIASNSLAKVKDIKALEPKIVKTVTNSNGAVIQDVITPDGKLERIVKPPKQVWDNAADQLIAFAISIEPGVEAPPLPSGITNDEFLRALKKDIVIKPDDSEKVKEIKRRVQETRREILEAMEATGKSFEQVLNDHRAQMNQNSVLYHDALKGLREIEQNGTPEEVAQYIEKSNELLRSQGAKELPVRNLQNQNENIEERR